MVSPTRDKNAHANNIQVEKLSDGTKYTRHDNVVSYILNNENKVEVISYKNSVDGEVIADIYVEITLNLLSAIVNEYQVSDN